jgi:hypothetical protein
MKMQEDVRGQEGHLVGDGGEPKVCNVCHLEYEGDECPWCKAEREHASGVIEERGRRSRRLKADAEGGESL